MYRQRLYSYRDEPSQKLRSQNSIAELKRGRTALHFQTTITTFFTEFECEPRESVWKGVRSILNLSCAAVFSSTTLVRTWNRTSAMSMGRRDHQNYKSGVSVWCFKIKERGKHITFPVLKLTEVWPIWKKKKKTELSMCSSIWLACTTQPGERRLYATQTWLFIQSEEALHNPAFLIEPMRLCMSHSLGRQKGVDLLN